MTAAGTRTTTDSLLGTQDLHVHTTMSDGDLPLDEVVRIAAEQGVAVGIADHISSRNVNQFVATKAELEDYLGALEEADVFRSGEFCWCDHMWSALSEEQRARFDYRIGSNHGFWLPDGSMASPWWRQLPSPWNDRPHDLMDVMIRNLCDMVRQMPIQIVAHPTLTPPALFDLEDDVLAWWTEPLEDRFIDAIVESGVALEISNRYRLPHDRFLRKAREAGARFSLGSDGHRANQIARLDWAVAAARRAGITDADLFVAERNQKVR